MKFKEGDRVICVNNHNGTITDDNKGRGSGWKLNKIFTIGHKTGDLGDGREILWPDNGDNGVFDDYVKPVSWKNRFGGKK